MEHRPIPGKHLCPELPQAKIPTDHHKVLEQGGAHPQTLVRVIYCESDLGRTRSRSLTIVLAMVATASPLLSIVRGNACRELPCSSLNY